MEKRSSFAHPSVVPTGEALSTRHYRTDALAGPQAGKRTRHLRRVNRTVHAVHNGAVFCVVSDGRVPIRSIDDQDVIGGESCFEKSARIDKRTLRRLQIGIIVAPISK